MRRQIDSPNAVPSIRIGFTDQRLTAHGGLMVWSQFLRQKKFRQQLRDVLPHAPTSPKASDPTEVARGYVGGILCGADQLSRVAWLPSDAAVAAVLGVAAIASQATLSRCSGVFTRQRCQVLGGLHARAADSLPTVREGYPLGSWALLHADGQQAGVAVGDPRLGLKPCPRPLIAGLAEAKLAANGWLRSGHPACGNGAAEFLRQTVQALPAHLRVGLVRGDSGFGAASVAALPVWRRDKGRADWENRIKELGGQFGIKRLCVDSFWGTDIWPSPLTTCACACSGGWASWNNAR